MQQARAQAAELEAAYRRTHYEIQVPGGELVTLRVDAASAALQRVHARCGVSCSAFLTAWNPRSAQQSRALNASANEALRARLAALGLDCWPGLGRDPRGAWPAEESLFVPGLELAAASFHARHFGQNALLHAAADAVPRLVWLLEER
ncbi:MAG: DUF3293 domain-containing protein [Gammaproteobacteria bacterium]|nr:DUF3293 domain-containing protein [Gammaproteobacteria bacterium]MDE2252238.1 DUF3293 domain-containing protein [Gammaproteobacteria bacterium]